MKNFINNSLNFRGNFTITILIVISFILLSLLFQIFQPLDSYSLDTIDQSLCKFKSSNFEEKFLQENYVLLEIQNKNTSVSIFPDIKNILCLGKVVNYEVTFFEQIDDTAYIKVNLFTFTGEKLLNFVKVFLLFLIFFTTKVVNFKNNFTNTYAFIFITYFIFVLNYFFSLDFDATKFFIESLFYNLFFIFLNLEESKYLNLINLKHNISIDSLRGIAVVAVILNHFDFKYFNSGYLGVDLFFIISGFVITNKYFSMEYQNMRSFFSDFIFFRLRRIIPVLLFFIASTSIFVYFLDFYYKSTLRVGLFSSIAISNIYLYLSSLDYFSTESSLNAFTHTWSLGIEEQFYLIFPILLYLIKNKKYSKHLFTALVLTSFILFYIYQNRDPNATYYLIHFRFWQLGIGCLLSIYKDELSKILYKIPLNLCIFLLLATFVVNTEYSRNLTLISTTIGAFIIYLSGYKVKSSKLLNNKQLALIGTLSYSIYLWHWPVIALTKWSNASFLNIEAQTLLIILLSYFSFKYVEQPFRKVLPENKSKVIGTILATTSILFVSIFVVIQNTERNNILSGKNPVIFEENDYKNIINQIECYHPEDTEDPFGNCMTHIPEKKNVYLIGDSHSTNHYFSLSKIYDSKPEYNFSHLVDWGFIREMQGIEGCGVGQNCIDNSYQKHLNFYNENLTIDDIVLISFSRDWFKLDGDLPRKDNQVKLKNFEEKFDILIKTISSKNSKIILIGDIPKTCKGNVNYINDIILKGNFEICTVDKDVSLEDREVLTNIFDDYLGDNIYFVDPHEYFCNEEQCSIVDISTNRLYYSDLSPHITEYGLSIMNQFWEKNKEVLRKK